MKLAIEIKLLNWKLNLTKQSIEIWVVNDNVKCIPPGSWILELTNLTNPKISCPKLHRHNLFDS